MPFIKSLELAVKIKVMCRREVTLEAAAGNQLVGAVSAPCAPVACLRLLAEFGSSVACFLEAGIYLHSGSVWGL